MGMMHIYTQNKNKRRKFFLKKQFYNSIWKTNLKEEKDLNEHNIRKNTSMVKKYMQRWLISAIFKKKWVKPQWNYYVPIRMAKNEVTDHIGVGIDVE